MRALSSVQKKEACIRYKKRKCSQMFDWKLPAPSGGHFAGLQTGKKPEDLASDSIRNSLIP